MALLAPLCLFIVAPGEITNRRLRPLMGQLLGVADPAYSARQMGYDRRRLAPKGLIHCVQGKLCCMLTPTGHRAALFLTKVYARVHRLGFQALSTSLDSHAPPPARRVRPRRCREGNTAPGGATSRMKL